MAVTVHWGELGTAILEEQLSMESVHSSEMFMPISCICGGVVQRTTMQGWS